MTYVDLEALARGLRLPEPQVEGGAAALITCLEKVFGDFDGLSTELLLEVLTDLGYRLDVSSDDPASVARFEEVVLEGALQLERDGRVWRREGRR